MNRCGLLSLSGVIVSADAHAPAHAFANVIANDRPFETVFGALTDRDTA
jgi:hypothetical protein